VKENRKVSINNQSIISLYFWYTLIITNKNSSGDAMSEKTIKVVLVCAAGMSSSLLEEKIRQAASDSGRAMELKAVDATTMSMWDYDKDTMDVILVAPQVRFKKRGIITQAEPHGVVVEDIDTIAYGMVDGEKIFNQVLEAFNRKN
jgi:cellobiose PTS system EIIB component